MKRFLIAVVSLILLMSSLNMTVFAAEVETLPEIGIGLKIDKINGVSANSQVTVNAGGRFDIDFTVDIPEKYKGGTATATVGGSGFTVYGALANTTMTFAENQNSGRVTVYVDSSVPSGRHPVTLDIVYKKGDAMGTASAVMNINVNGQIEPEIPDTSNGAAVLNIVSAPTGPVNAGETFDVSFSSYCTLPTYGFGFGYGYSNGTVTVSGTDFSLAGALAELDITSGTNTVSILSGKNLQTGRYQCTLTVTYKTSDGQNVSASKTLNIDIVSGTEEINETEDNASFKLTGASIPESKGKANLSTTLKLSFENTTDFAANNVKIKLTNLGELILNTYTDTIDVGDVAGGQTFNASFPVKFPEQIASPQVRLEATLTYDTPAGPQSVPYSIYLQAAVTKPAEETPEAQALTPKVIVSQYNVDVEKVASGEQFTLTFTLKNTSAAKDLYNMTVDVEPMGMSSSAGSSGPVFTFIDGTSSFYTDKLEKDGTLEYSIRLKCSASAGAGSYPIRISYDYQYMVNGMYQTSPSQSMDINIPVSQPIKFELVDWVAPTEAPIDGLMVSFQYYNKSRNPMTALTISAEGDFTMPTQNVGTLNPSSADYFNGTLYPTDGVSVGDVKTVKLVFTFEDAAGEEQRLEETFDVTITEAMGGDMMGGDMMGGDIIDYPFGGDVGIDAPMPDIEYDENGMPINGDSVEDGGFKLPLWAKITIPCVAALIVIIVIAVVVKKVKEKRDEDDD